MKFKTNINCSNCKATVTPFLDKEVSEGNWEVDLSHPDRILTVQSGQKNPLQIVDAVKKAGFTAEPIQDSK